MIVVDASVLIAILFDEYKAADYLRRLSSDDYRVVAAPTVLEALMVAQRVLGLSARAEIKALLGRTGIRVAAWGQEHLEQADIAFRRFGKGSGHPAQLNFGDCMTYAFAQTLEAQLLFKGNDFSRTDIRPAL